MIEAATPLLRPTLPATAALSLDLRVLGFAAAVAIGVSLIVGVLPALQMSSRALGNAAGLTARGSSSRDGARRLIVAAEVAISLVLVCGAVLMFKSLLKLQRVDAGVRIDNVITMSADLSIGTYPNSASAARFIEAVGDRLRAVPGVDRAAVSTDVPLLGVRQGDAHDRRRHRGRHRRALQAGRCGVLHHARHPDPGRPGHHAGRPASALRASWSSTSRWRASWRSASRSPIRKRWSAGSPGW